MYEFTSTTLWNGDLYKKIVADKANKQVEIYRQGVYRNDANHHICLYWSKGHEGYLDVLSLDSLPQLGTENYRLALYITSIGNADPMFANDLVHKGRPVFVEFHSDQAGDAVKETLIKNLNKYQNVTFDHQILIPTAADLAAKLTAEGLKSNVTAADAEPTADAKNAKAIVCANEYMRITKAVLEQENENGGWDVISDLKESGVYTGAEGFGTFENLEKDYRLPTAANLRWKRPQADEMPRPGVLYDQITIHYTVHRGHVGGMGAVGQQVTSETTHVFWVPADVAEEKFINAFVGTDGAGNFEVALAKKVEGNVVAYTTADYVHEPVVKAKKKD